jgi:hypothetical protein
MNTVFRKLLFTILSFSHGVAGSGRGGRRQYHRSSGLRLICLLFDPKHLLRYCAFPQFPDSGQRELIITTSAKRRSANVQLKSQGAFRQTIGF